MFETVRYAMAVTKSLMDLRDRGLISDDKRAAMHQIMGADVNRQFGADCLRLGAVRNKEAAVAAVYARLAGAAQRTPTSQISADDWRAATRQALLNGGATEAESFLAVEELIHAVRLG